MKLYELFRSRFRVSENYLDGNSLGPFSVDAQRAVLRVLGEWECAGIGGWTEGENPWLFLPERIGALLAPLIGAAPDEVIPTGSTTVNLHQLLATLYGGGLRIVCDALAFPSDRYAIESQIALQLGSTETDLIVIPSHDGYTLTNEAIAGALTQPMVTVAVLPSVIYTSGQLLDIAYWSNFAREHDVALIWDLSHSIGVVPHKLSEWGCDAAFWCSYKWLNAGPGAVGGLYVNQRYFGVTPGLAGWFGSKREAMFSSPTQFQPADGAAAFQIGTTHLLSLAALEATAQMIAEAGIENIRRESLELTRLLRTEARCKLSRFGVSVVTPEADDERGGHIALRHPEAAALCRALRRVGVTPDHRAPDLIRFAPSPLFNTPEECVTAIERLREILESDVHRSADPPSLVP